MYFLLRLTDLPSDGAQRSPTWQTLQHGKILAIHKGGNLATTVVIASFLVAIIALGLLMNRFKDSPRPKQLF